MLVRCALLLVTATSLLVGATLPPPDRPYNFLMLLPACSISHRNVFMPLVAALTQRGHKITMITPFAAPDNNPNVTYINHGLPFDPQSHNMFEIRDDMSLMINLFMHELPELTKEFYNIPSVREIYNKRKQFDLIIFDWSFNELAYPFAHEQSFITIITSGIDSYRSASQGNLLNPAYVPSIAKDFKQPLSFIDRIYNIFLHAQLPVMWRYMVLPKIQEEVDKHFPGLPSLLDIERNQSLSLMNSHYTLDMPLPVLPTQVEVGGMHCRPGKPLPNDIADFLHGDGDVIYFSLGTVTKGDTMPTKYQDIFVSAFAKLSYKIIWKFETERRDIPSNVLMKKWMPQQDILAHPNVKLFISHCGLLSTQEAIYHGKPVLGLPVFGDQPRNADKLKNQGIGRMLVWEDLTEDILLKEITELMTNPSYTEKIAQISATFNDQLEPPVERAVFWTEYVVRHNGATHLRSPELDLSWRQLLHLDIILAVHIILYLLYKLLRILVALCFGTKSSSRKTKRE